MPGSHTIGIVVVVDDVVDGESVVDVDELAGRATWTTSSRASVELVVGAAVVAVVDVTISGAHRSFATVGVRVRLPNWSRHSTGASTALAHFTL